MFEFFRCLSLLFPVPKCLAAMEAIIPRRVNVRKTGKDGVMDHDGSHVIVNDSETYRVVKMMTQRKLYKPTSFWWDGIGVFFMSLKRIWLKMESYQRLWYSRCRKSNANSDLVHPSCPFLGIEQPTKIVVIFGWLPLYILTSCAEDAASQMNEHSGSYMTIWVTSDQKTNNSWVTSNFATCYHLGLYLATVVPR